MSKVRQKFTQALSDLFYNFRGIINYPLLIKFVNFSLVVQWAIGSHALIISNYLFRKAKDERKFVRPKGMDNILRNYLFLWLHRELSISLRIDEAFDRNQINDVKTFEDIL